MHDLATTLRDQGHRPCVLTPVPNLETPYSLSKEAGVDVFRIRCPKTKDRKYLARVLAEFVMPVLMIRALRKHSLGNEKWDGVVWYSPSIFFGPLIHYMRRRAKCGSYLILRDIFPKWALDAGLMKKGLPYYVLRLVELFQYRQASIIGIQSPSNSAHFGHAHHRGQRIEVLNNWLKELPSSERIPEYISSAIAGKTVLVYAGNMGRAQDMDCVLDLAEQIRDRPELCVVLVGRGSEEQRLRKQADDRHLTNVLFGGELTHPQVGDLMRQSHIGLLTLHASHRTHNVPGKFLAYLRSGLPVLARVNPGNDLLDLIPEARVGFAVSGSEDIDQFVKSAIKLIDDEGLRAEYGANSASLAEREYSPESAASQLVSALQRTGNQARS